MTADLDNAASAPPATVGAPDAFSSADRRSTKRALLIIAVASLLAFLPVLRCGFVTWDDLKTVAQNPLVLSPDARSVTAVWTQPQGDLYIPVTYSVWKLAALVATGDKPVLVGDVVSLASPHVFHALNLLIHIAAAGAMFAVLKLLCRNTIAATIGALVFALHPVQVESVAWVSGLKDVLAGALSLTAIALYLRLAQDSATSKRCALHYALATLVFVAAMLAKPSAMVVPAIVIVLDRFLLGRSWKRMLQWTSPWLALSIGCAIATKLIQPATHVAGATVSPLARPVIAADALAFYVGKLVAPLSLTFDYGRNPQRAIDAGWVAWTWIIPVTLAIAAIVLRRRAPIVGVAFLIFAIALSPVLGFVRFDFQAYSTVADHYLYLAMLGPVLLVAWALAHWPGRALRVCAIALLVALAGRSFVQISHWTDSRSLFTHAIRINPRSFAAYGSLASLAIDQGDIPRAVALSNRAIAINPDWAGSYLTAAEAARLDNRPADAIKLLQKSLSLNPTRAEALANLAGLLAETHRLDLAIPNAEAAVQSDPRSVPYRMNLATMYLQANRVSDAKTQLRVVLSLDPTNRAARSILEQIPRSP